MASMESGQGVPSAPNVSNPSSRGSRGSSTPRRPRGRNSRAGPEPSSSGGNENEPPDRPANSNASPNRGARRGGHRVRGGRSRTGNNAQPSTRQPQTPQTSVPAPAQTDGAVDLQNIPVNANAGRGGRGRGGRGGRGNQRANVPRTVGARAFGGQLTQPGGASSPIPEDSSIQNAQLDAHAPSFTPGASFTPNPRARGGSRGGSRGRGKQRRTSISSAPDLSTRIHEDIDRRLYECNVCTSEVTRRDKIWSCHTCWTVFHLNCIKKWSSRSIQQASQNQNRAEDDETPKTWRCPGCNLPQDVLPTSFRCWCEKDTDPASLPGLPPFSCGQTCHRERACPHPCASICHAGPCEPCAQMGPSQPCFCGREDKTRKCMETDYKNGWSCGQVCNEVMPCGEHYCGKPCHEGLCGACEVPIEATCYCGQDHSIISCFERAADVDSRKTIILDDGSSKAESWIGLFNCEKPCNRDFDCGRHKCQKTCHAQDEPVPHCPRSPDVVTTCPCGKTALAEITDNARTSCEDDIPLCAKPCHKKMQCGHSCQRVCHTGECFPCLSLAEVSCRCGRMTVDTMCHQGTLEPPMCTRICRSTLNCGRHECGEHCCPGERKANERIATKKKLGRSLLSTSALGSEHDFEAEHICTRVCGRQLKCGSHTCQELCHRGPCKSCLEAVFEEVSCHCGRTVLNPPLPCGTQAPPCFYQCERSKECGHPQVSHNCHTDSETCPKCVFLTTKTCLCGKNQLKNQQCWITSPRCGEVCNKKLKCGYHRCQKQCHTAGECEDSTKPCTQACGKAKSCHHPCSLSCHSPFPCKEDTPCAHKIFITCPCQRLKTETRCSATRASPGNNEKTLTCDEECLRLERNRKLQLAFNIDAATHTDDHIPYSTDTIQLYLDAPVWAATQEKAMRAFAVDPDQKRLRFKPMKRNQRAFIHALAQDFGVDSESMDPEPHRHVALFKTPRFVMAPMKTLADCVRIRQLQSTAPVAKTKLRASNLVGAPFNALLLTKIRFGLTIDELRKTLAAADPTTASMSIEFLPSDEVVLQFPSAIADLQLEAQLTALKNPVAAALGAQQMASVQLATVDASLNVERRETDSASGGWSQVARAGAAPRTAPVVEPLGSKSSYVVLGSSAGKKKKKEAVVEDWEEEEELEEARERLSGEIERDLKE
ncbi:hypothetical protein BT63DRAFT_455667 [Microthyrium microscopicum]|uniref:R3H domain-containing protein n=1 Tax=Microthyrium microscopicum TaxID=703497 RepID=A0A6A6UBN8_9PEZI|nr:hypothetical protein BT63DRAFT_455667 [Microthyrium microscopicum]